MKTCSFTTQGRCVTCGVKNFWGGCGLNREEPPLPAHDDYGTLKGVLDRALEQARSGKGHQRHSTGEGFIDQPIMTIGRRYGHGFNLGQAEKKMQESLRMARGAAINELLGAINYIAAAILILEETE